MSISTRLRRHPERALPDDAACEALLAEAAHAHVGMVVDGLPLVIPLLCHHESGVLYVHGSRASRALRHIASGAPVCATVTVLDALVASRSAFNHSANYRSVVLFGRGEPVDDPGVKAAVLARMTARLFAGRTAGRDYTPPTRRELNVTILAGIRIEAMSGKSRTGPPSGPTDGALATDHPARGMWAGLVPWTDAAPGG